MMNDESNIIDCLFRKYKLLDSEGFLVGTEDPKLIAVFNRIEELSKKEKLSPNEIEEGEELIEVQKAYTKEANAFLLYEQTRQADLEDSDEDDSTFDGENISSRGSEYSDDYSYNSDTESTEE
jgi:hypothetical protein